jgi:DNA polymerase III epsilon subunit-like protein
MSRPELFVSIDIETDGPAPGLNSMLALGAAAFPADGSKEQGWYCTLTPLEGAVQNPDTMDWWKQPSQRAAWKEVTAEPTDADFAIIRFVEWLEEDLRGFKLIAVGWPIAFDFAFVNYYCHKFTGRNPLGFAGLDIRSYANGLADHPQYYSLPENEIWNMAGGKPSNSGLRPHHALDDAIGQGRLFMALRKEALMRRELKGDPRFRMSAADQIRFNAREETIHELSVMDSNDRTKLLSIYRHPSGK